jgi:nucleoside triphosphate pyrophosphatase
MAAELLLLASGSPRRRQLLRILVPEFAVGAPDVDEQLQNPIHQDLQRLAIDKARAIEHNGMVVAADTVLMLGDQIVGKPTSRPDAVLMLQSLSARTTTVLTALAVLDRQGRITSEVVSTQVRLHPLDTEDIQRYVDTGAADDKAGALEIQDRAAKFVASTVGCRANLYGLPLCATSRLLSGAGLQVQILDNQSCCGRRDLEEYLRVNR